MKTTVRTDDFETWLEEQDSLTAARLTSAINKLEHGLGDIEPVGEGVSELKLHFGPGFRLYFDGTNPKVIVMLCGGTKRSQSRDIKKAKAMKNQLE